MELEAVIGEDRWQVQLPGYDLSIPLHFNGDQPNTYGVPKATSAAFEGGGFVGDTRRGGSCNFETHHLTPHCNGTHTECVGHIAEERIAIRAHLQDSLVPACLISVQPVHPSESEDHYVPPANPEDLMLDKASLKAALEDTEPCFLNGLLIRTLPNDDSKLSRDYMQTPPAFFSLEAMEYVRELGVQHLLVDMPSVDRLFDEGRLSAHHIYWEVPQGSHAVQASDASLATITEMIYAGAEVSDGNYLLNIQIAPFMTDAAPSRPLLYPLKAI